MTVPPEIVGRAEACIFELEAARGAMQGAVDLLCDLDRVAE